MADDDERYEPDAGLGENPLIRVPGLYRKRNVCHGHQSYLLPDKHSYLKTVLSHSMSYSSNHLRADGQHMDDEHQFFDELQ